MKRKLLVVVGILLLVFSWVALFFWVDGFVMLSFIPYDDVMPEARPSLGTWQRHLNDFFERPPGRHLPAWLIVGASIAVFIISLGRAPQSPAVSIRLGLSFALSNLLLVVAMAFSISILGSLPLELPSLNPMYHYHPGYGWTFKFILTDTLLLGLWLALQVWGIPKWVLARFPREVVQGVWQ
jgi:multisubunit Na+/H+ antiporter MnhB subunit